MSTGVNMATALKALIERIRPNLDHYRKLPRKARVTRVNRSGDLRTVDLVILHNNGRPDKAEPPLSRVPLLGIAVPKAGAVVAVDYFRGDPAAPVVAGVLDQGAVNLDEVLAKATAGLLHLDQTGELEIYGDGVVWLDGDPEASQVVKLGQRKEGA